VNKKGPTYNRECVRGQYEGMCSPGTGLRQTRIYVKVRGPKYHVMGEVSFGFYTPCASVA
jgi:hypothetical protein